MKKLLLFLAMSLIAQMSYCQTYQLFSVTPFTQVERVNDEWRMTAPIDLQYNVLKSFGVESNYFVGMGAGAGIAFNANGTGNINLNFPLTAYIGGNLFPGFPSIAFGGGVNMQTGNPLLMINLHFVSTALIPSIEKAAPRYSPIITNDAYKRSKIGFNHD